MILVLNTSEPFCTVTMIAVYQENKKKLLPLYWEPFN